MVNKEFRVHILNERGKEKAFTLAAIFDNLLTEVLGMVAGKEAPPTNGREIALVRTHLELASFYSKKAMAQLPENTEGA